MPRYTVNKDQAKSTIPLTAGFLVDLLNDMESCLHSGYRWEGKRKAAMQARIKRRVEQAGISLNATHGYPAGRIENDDESRAAELNLRDAVWEGRGVVGYVAYNGALNQEEHGRLVKALAEEIGKVASECARLKSAANGRTGRILALLGAMAAAENFDAEHVTMAYQEHAHALINDAQCYVASPLFQNIRQNRQQEEEKP